MKSSTAVFLPWIKTYGPFRLARDLKMHPSTIRKWRQGHCPRPEVIKQICELSGGKVTAAHIIDEVLR